MTNEIFGHLPDGREVRAVTLETGDGLRAEILSYGGILRSLSVPDRKGTARNVVLGFTGLDDYLAKSPYFGAIIGRNANRIAKGRFTLDGRDYSVAQNDPPNNLHGGHEGFDKKLWEIEELDSSSVTLHYLSADGEEGFPGNLDVRVRYSVGPGNVLRIDCTATTDAPTIVNLTNHSYFNLGGEGSGSILDHVATLGADHYLPVGDDLIPTGRLEAVAGTEMDFRMPHPLGERIRTGSHQIQISKGYDHNFLLTGKRVEDGLSFGARIEDPRSGRVLEVWTTEPYIDFYTGNFLDGTLVGPSGTTYRQGDAFAIEPEKASNAINTPEPSTILCPGETYRTATEYRFGVTG
jgi:aldose 1-epimerase